jgi:hypothetical protein
MPLGLAPVLALVLMGVLLRYLTAAALPAMWVLLGHAA